MPFSSPRMGSWNRGEKKNNRIQIFTATKLGATN